MIIVRFFAFLFDCPRLDTGGLVSIRLLPVRDKHRFEHCRMPLDTLANDVCIGGHETSKSFGEGTARRGARAPLRADGDRAPTRSGDTSCAASAASDARAS